MEIARFSKERLERSDGRSDERSDVGAELRADERGAGSVGAGSPSSGQDPSSPMPRATVPPRRGFTLREGVVEFFHHLSPVLIALTVLAAWGVRIRLGDWSVGDFVIIAAVLAIWPFQEWILHVFVLHFKPFQIGGRRIDLRISWTHRRHHGNPLFIPHVFIPKHIVIPSIPLFSLAVFWLSPRPTLALTTIGFYFLMALLYEWTHFLIHTSYRPRSRLYRRMWQNHRLHHFKNENYWFGILMPFVDGWLRTAPDRKAVETSPTCRTLGVQEPARSP